MVQGCVVVGCRSEAYPGCGRSYHRFPSDEETKAKWIKILMDISPSTTISKLSVICSKHFKDEDYITQNRKRLKPQAVPSIFVKEKQLEYGFLAKKLFNTSSNPESDDDDTPLSSFLESAFVDDDSHEGPAILTEENTITQEHVGVKCSECEGDIQGFRYVCVECTDWDMCGSCEARGAHRQHYVLRLPGPRPQLLVVSLIEGIQKQLKKFLTELASFDSMDHEIKEEYEEDASLPSTDDIEECLVPSFKILKQKQADPCLQETTTIVLAEPLLNKINLIPKPKLPTATSSSPYLTVYPLITEPTTKNTFPDTPRKRTIDTDEEDLNSETNKHVAKRKPSNRNESAES